MSIEGIRIIHVEKSGWCNVRMGGNRWGVLFVRAIPLWFISIPGASIACAAILPSAKTIISRNKNRESRSQSTMSSRNRTSKECSNEIEPRPNSPTSATSPAPDGPPSDLSPSTFQSVPYSIYGLFRFFDHWKGNNILNKEDTILSDYVTAGICMATLILVFIIFATNDPSIKQYKQAYFANSFSIFRRKKDSIHVDIVRNVEANVTKESRESITSRTVLPEENNISSNEAQENIAVVVSSKNSITSKHKKRWSILTASQESLVESERAGKKRRSTEGTLTFNIDENSSPLFKQKTNLHTHNSSMSSTSIYSSATAIAIEPSETLSPQSNNDPPDKPTAIPILGGLSPAPRRNSPHFNPLRDYEVKDDDVTMKRLSSPQIRHIQTNPRLTASAPTSPTLLQNRSRSPPGLNYMRTSRMSTDRYNSRRPTSPLRRPSSPIANNRSSGSSSTNHVAGSQGTPTSTLEDMQDEYEDDGTDPFPSLLKLGKTFNDDIGSWRSSSPLTLGSRSIRMSNSGTFNSRIWDRPDTEAISIISSSETMGSLRNSGNLSRSGSLPIVNYVNGNISRIESQKK
ncbi:9290_t:CDS:2 [Funneliformis caledonium]|uniref:9290_t:CDS:1 n=1 Tax=Funneliformis caledonium TaxID=1117310 RepID=A0A9N9CXD8_9GLOM|nr:9290_t:CDS:2 [Funneliformis caledonium]